MESSQSTKVSLWAGVAAAAGATVCCIGPALLALAGMSGLAVSLRVLQPFEPFLIAAALAAMGYASYRLFLRRAVCGDGETACARPTTTRQQRIGFIAALIVVTALLSVPYWV